MRFFSSLVCYALFRSRKFCGTFFISAIDFCLQDSNIDLREQYPNVKTTEPATWKAFLRRIHKVIEYKADGSTINYGNATDYIFPPTPDWVTEMENSKQDFLPL